MRSALIHLRSAVLLVWVALLAGRAPGLAWAAPEDGGTVPLYLLAPDGSVLRFVGPGSWSRVGGPFKKLLAGPDKLFALAPSGDIFEYDGSAGWSQIGGPGYSFVVDGHGRLAGITPDRHAVMQYRGNRSGWFRIGNEMAELVGGGDRLYGVTPSGELVEYGEKPDLWSRIGGPGVAFAANLDGIYGLTPNRDAIDRYDRVSRRWTVIGGATHGLYAGGHSLFRITEQDDIEHLGGTSWSRIGGPGALFTVDARGNLAGISPGRQQVWRWSGVGDAWIHLGGAAVDLVAGGPVASVAVIVAQRPLRTDTVIVTKPVDTVIVTKPVDTAIVTKPVGGCYYTTAIRHRCTGVPYDTREDKEIDQICNGCLHDSHCIARPGGRCVQILAGACGHNSQACTYPGEPCYRSTTAANCPTGWCFNDNGHAACGVMPTSPPSTPSFRRP